MLALTSVAVPLLLGEGLHDEADVLNSAHSVKLSLTNKDAPSEGYRASADTDVCLGVGAKEPRAMQQNPENSLVEPARRAPDQGSDEGGLMQKEGTLPGNLQAAGVVEAKAPSDLKTSTASPEEGIKSQEECPTQREAETGSAPENSEAGRSTGSVSEQEKVTESLQISGQHGPQAREDRKTAQTQEDTVVLSSDGGDTNVTDSGALPLSEEPAQVPTSGREQHQEEKPGEISLERPQLQQLLPPAGSIEAQQSVQTSLAGNGVPALVISAASAQPQNTPSNGAESSCNQPQPLSLEIRSASSSPEGGLQSVPEQPSNETVALQQSVQPPQVSQQVQHSQGQHSEGFQVLQPPLPMAMQQQQPGGQQLQQPMSQEEHLVTQRPQQHQAQQQSVPQQQPQPQHQQQQPLPEPQLQPTQQQVSTQQAQQHQHPQQVPLQSQSHHQQQVHLQPQQTFQQPHQQPPQTMQQYQQQQHQLHQQQHMQPSIVETQQQQLNASMPPPQQVAIQQQGVVQHVIQQSGQQVMMVQAQQHPQQQQQIQPQMQPQTQVVVQSPRPQMMQQHAQGSMTPTLQPMQPQTQQPQQSHFQQSAGQGFQPVVSSSYMVAAPPSANSPPRALIIQQTPAGMVSPGFAPGDFGSWAPFTTAQWHELEQQAMVFKYLVAGAPVPQELVESMRVSLANSMAGQGHIVSFGQPMWGAAHVDPEPFRCRRTDGKKWRCSREVVPDQKYCERHMHRGRNRARKITEKSTPGSSLVSAEDNSDMHKSASQGASEIAGEEGGAVKLDRSESMVGISSGGPPPLALPPSAHPGSVDHQQGMHPPGMHHPPQHHQQQIHSQQHQQYQTQSHQPPGTVMMQQHQQPGVPPQHAQGQQSLQLFPGGSQPTHHAGAPHGSTPGVSPVPASYQVVPQPNAAQNQYAGGHHQQLSKPNGTFSVGGATGAPDHQQWQRAGNGPPQFQQQPQLTASSSQNGYHPQQHLHQQPLPQSQQHSMQYRQPAQGSFQQQNGMQGAPQSVHHTQQTLPQQQASLRRQPGVVYQQHQQHQQQLQVHPQQQQQQHQYVQQQQQQPSGPPQNGLHHPGQNPPRPNGSVMSQGFTNAQHVQATQAGAVYTVGGQPGTQYAQQIPNQQSQASQNYSQQQFPPQSYQAQQPQSQALVRSESQYSSQSSYGAVETSAGQMQQQQYYGPGHAQTQQQAQQGPNFQGQSYMGTSGHGTGDPQYQQVAGASGGQGEGKVPLLRVPNMLQVPNAPSGPSPPPAQQPGSQHLVRNPSHQQQQYAPSTQNGGSQLSLGLQQAPQQMQPVHGSQNFPAERDAGSIRWNEGPQSGMSPLKMRPGGFSTPLEGASEWGQQGEAIAMPQAGAVAYHAAVPAGQYRHPYGVKMDAGAQLPRKAGDGTMVEQSADGNGSSISPNCVLQRQHCHSDSSCAESPMGPLSVNDNGMPMPSGFSTASGDPCVEGSLVASQSDN